MSIFKAYDIRGIYPATIDEDMVYNIGRAYVRKFKPKTVSVGRDMRTSSPKLHKALIDGITDEGCDVVDIGLVTTPMMYFSVWKYGFDGGLMVTASHNPGKYNGIKMVKEDAIPIGGETGIYEIGSMVENMDDAKGDKGSVTKKSIMAPYVQHSLNYLGDVNPFIIVVDTANGMAGPVVKEFFQHVDCELIHLYPELDGSFPNHEANPLKEENMEDLRKAVLNHDADIGIAFDGDGDRCAFIDEKGTTIPSDYVTALVAEIILKNNPGQKILSDVRSSKIVTEVVREHGGKAGRSKVGHSLVKAQMKEENARFAGELSGHFYLEEERYAEAPFFMIAKVLELMTDEGKALSELVEPLKKYYQSGEINSKVEDKQGKMKELAEHYEDADIDWLDGVTIQYNDWWFNVRPSNTEPYLRLNLEADSKELMDEKTQEVLNIIRN